MSISVLNGTEKYSNVLIDTCTRYMQLKFFFESDNSIWPPCVGAKLIFFEVCKSEIENMSIKYNISKKYKSTKNFTFEYVIFQL